MNSKLLVHSMHQMLLLQITISTALSLTTTVAPLPNLNANSLTSQLYAFYYIILTQYSFHQLTICSYLRNFTSQRKRLSSLKNQSGGSYTQPGLCDKHANVPAPTWT